MKSSGEEKKNKNHLLKCKMWFLYNKLSILLKTLLNTKLRETEWPCQYLDINPENLRGCASNSTRAYSLAFIQLDPTEVLTPVQQDRRPESVLQRGSCFDIPAVFNILMSRWPQGHVTKSTAFRGAKLETLCLCFQISMGSYCFWPIHFIVTHKLAIDQKVKDNKPVIS